MRPAPAWAAPYVGIPYADHGRTRAGCDCWGLARLVLREVFGRELPDYADGYAGGRDWQGIARAVARGLAQGWRRVDAPQAGDLLILTIAARPWHCALMVDSRQFLHTDEDCDSVVESLDNPRWQRRREGVYRHG